MDTQLKNILWEGEEVRWSGRPKPFPLIDQDSKNSILLTWIVSALVLAAVVVLMIQRHRRYSLLHRGPHHGRCGPVPACGPLHPALHG